MTNSKSSVEDDDLDCVGHLEFSVSSLSYHQYTIPIDEVITVPRYYRKAAEAITEAKQGDLVRFKLSSPGGRLDGAFVLMDAIAKTDATTQAEIIGDCSSAASMIALSCDNVHVGPYATMNVHNVRYGSGGKASDIVAHVNHTTKTTEKLFREVYEGFLTEDEIEDALKGKELYFDAEEILDRLKVREDYFTALEEEIKENAGLTD